MDYLVPYIPGVLPHLTHPGGRSNHLFHITDWVPTLAALTGVSLTSPDIDGVDQSALLRGNLSSAPRRDVVLELDPVYKQAAYIRGSMKLILGDPAPKPYNDVYQPLTGEMEQEIVSKSHDHGEPVH